MYVVFIAMEPPPHFRCARAWIRRHSCHTMQLSRVIPVQGHKHGVSGGSSMESFMFSAPVPATLHLFLNDGLAVLVALVIAATPLALALRYATKRHEKHAVPRR